MITAVLEYDLKEYYEVMMSSYRDAAIKAGFPDRGRSSSFSYEDLISAYHKGDKLFHKRYEDRTVGIIRMKLNGTVCKINDIAVLPKYQRNGYGRELLDFIKAKAAELGADKIELGMFDDNAELGRWYENNGFKTVETMMYENSPHIIRRMESIL